MGDYRLPEEVSAAWASFDAHVIHDVTRMDDVLAANEQARYDEWSDALADAFEDGDDE